MTAFTPFHIHFLTRVTLKSPAHTASDLCDWLTRLVENVGMHVLGGPFVFPCSDAGNEGITGGIFLKESHANFHLWDRVDQPYFQMDLYSCKLFSTLPVLEMFDEFEPTGGFYQLIDRNGSPFQILEEGRLFD